MKGVVDGTTGGMSVEERGEAKAEAKAKNQREQTLEAEVKNRSEQTLLRKEEALWPTMHVARDEAAPPVTGHPAKQAAIPVTLISESITATCSLALQEGRDIGNMSDEESRIAEIVPDVDNGEPDCRPAGPDRVNTVSGGSTDRGTNQLRPTTTGCMNTFFPSSLSIHFLALYFIHLSHPSSFALQFG